jgi:FkbM family methyltransferase
MRVVCCEPFPDTAAKARENLAAYGDRVEVHQVAVFDGATQVKLHANDLKPSDSTNIAVAGVLDMLSVPLAPGGLRVPATTLDTLIEECGHVDVLKFDCEGSEYAILSTATRLNQVSRIVCE